MIRHTIGYGSASMLKENGTLSITQKSRKTTKVSPKLISEDTVRENRKRYFGTFIFENIAEFPRREPMPPFVASLKKEYTIFPQKRNVV